MQGCVTFAPCCASYSIYSINKNLEAQFDARLIFVHYVNVTTASARPMLGFVSNNCKQFNSSIALIILYSAFVGSCLEYSSLVLCHCYMVHCNTLEKIQRRCLKFLFFQTRLSRYIQRDTKITRCCWVISDFSPCFIDEF